MKWSRIIPGKDYGRIDDCRNFHSSDYECILDGSQLEYQAGCYAIIFRYDDISEKSRGTYSYRSDFRLDVCSVKLLFVHEKERERVILYFSRNRSSLLELL